MLNYERVPTIYLYKAYVSGLCFREHPHNLCGLKYGNVAHFWILQFPSNYPHLTHFICWILLVWVETTNQLLIKLLIFLVDPTCHYLPCLEATVEIFWKKEKREAVKGCQNL